jgi:hypothetical protein
MPRFSLCELGNEKLDRLSFMHVRLGLEAFDACHVGNSMLILMISVELIQFMGRSW